MKKLPVIFISLLFGVSSLWAQQIRMIVKVDRAVVYAEPSENSYKIDTVRSGTVLTLFKKGIDSAEWIYVTFESRRWKGKVTGFIKAELVATEEEMLKEEQRRMEEETPEEAVTEAEEGKEAELKEETEIKPQEELPDMRAAFAKKKAEEKELLEETPQAKEMTAPETKMVEEEEFKRPEPPPPVVTITDGITESPQGRSFALVQTREMAETKPYAIIKREFEPPPSQLKAGEKIEEEAETELQSDVLAVKEEEPPPEEEEKEFLEKTPQAKEIIAPNTGIAAEEEFKRPEPPPPVVTVMDALTESPRNRAVSLAARPEFIEMMVYEFIEIVAPEPEKTEEQVEETIESEKEEVTPPPAETVEKEEEGKEEEESQAAKPTEQVVKPPEQVVKPPKQVVKPTELSQPKRPDEIGLLSFGFGYGPTWGGLGGSVQLNINKSISIHVGAGFYPTTYYYSEYDWATNEWLYNVGIKYYLPFGSEKIRTYLDLMYGGISVEAVQLVKEIWYNEYTFENIQKTLYGPSLVAGAEWKLGFYALNGYLGLSYNTTAWDYWDQDYFLNGGLGISLYF